MIEKLLTPVLVASVTISPSFAASESFGNNYLFTDAQYANPPQASDDRCGDIKIEKVGDLVPHASSAPVAEKIVPGIASDSIRGVRPIKYYIVGYDLDQKPIIDKKPNAPLDYFGKDFSQLDMVVISDVNSGYKFGTFFKYRGSGRERFIFYGQSRVGNVNFLLLTCKFEWNSHSLDEIISNINALPLMIPPASPNSTLPQTKTKKI